MIRAVAAVVALFLATNPLAAAQRYMVGTKHLVRPGGLAALRASVGDIEPANVREFVAFRGFSAELTEEEAARLRASGTVRFVTPVVERRALDVPRNRSGQTLTYGVQNIGASQAWAAERKTAVNVAILDTGIDPTHPELKDRYAGGANFIIPNASPADNNDHGTHVAGIIGAANNDAGVAGIAPDVRLWAVKVLDQDGIGTDDSVALGLDWVIRKKREIGGHWVVNMSLGASDESIGEREACQLAADEGIILVAASGNSAMFNPEAAVNFPAAYPSVVAVGATDIQRAHAEFSNKGPELDLSAPGVEVLSTLRSGQLFDSYIRTTDDQLASQGLVGSATGRLTGEYVDCGLGRPEDFPPSVRGKIAVMKRGELKFAIKAFNAMQAGAVASIIYNNGERYDRDWTLVTEEAPPGVTWPMVMRMATEEGEDLVRVNRGAITLVNEADDYGVKSGTSMSTPHVAGAVALLWSIAPGASGATVISSLLTTARDLGEPGRDNLYGAGEVDVYAAAKLLAPEAFEGRPTTGRRILRRGH